MNFNLVTIFPEITKLLDFGVIGKAIEKDLISINGLNPRDFSKNTNKNVFGVRTSNDLASLIREHCKSNNLSTNQFLNNLIKQFFNHA